MGGRLAAWAVGYKNFQKHPFIGTGEGCLNSFINVNTSFSKPKNFVIHFHNDYIQAAIVGGFVLLFGLLGTQLWLFFRSLNDPFLLYLLTGMISYGFGELAFLDKQTFLVFTVLWLIFTCCQKQPKKLSR